MQGGAINSGSTVYCVLSIISGTVPCHIYSLLILTQLLRNGAVIPISQMRKLRLS